MAFSPSLPPSKTFVERLALRPQSIGYPVIIMSDIIVDNKGEQIQWSVLYLFWLVQLSIEEIIKLYLPKKSPFYTMVKGIANVSQTWHCTFA